MMKNTAYCLISNGMGGAENIVLQTLQQFKNASNFYLIINNEIAPYFQGILPPERIYIIGDIYLHNKYNSIRYVLNNRYFNFRRLSIDNKLNKTTEFIKRNDIEIIHAHLDYALYLGLKIKSIGLPNLRVIFTVHSGFGFLEDKSLKPQLPFKYINFSSVDIFIFVSNYVYELYKKNITINEYKIIYNGIDSYNIKSINRTYNPTDTFNILFLGGDKPVKGFDMLVDTVDILVNKYDVKNIKVSVLGPLSSGGNLHQLIETKQLSSYFDLIGYTKSTELPDYFHKAHVLFMPSRTEAMPLAAIEAVFYNLPVVASKVGGIPEVIQNNVNGYCCEIYSENFANSIRELCSHYNSIVIKATNYNLALKNQFTLIKMCTDLLSLYSINSLDSLKY